MARRVATIRPSTSNQLIHTTRNGTGAGIGVVAMMSMLVSAFGLGEVTPEKTPR
jgi:hypothetical protein